MGLLAFQAEVPMRQLQCGECGITFYAPEVFMSEKQHNGGAFHCPNGHSRVYRETDVAKLEKQLVEERRRREAAERREEWANAEARTARTQETKAKNKLKKITVRIDNGVCPHCNRTFSQLARHMKCKHAQMLQKAS